MSRPFSPHLKLFPQHGLGKRAPPAAASYFQSECLNRVQQFQSLPYSAMPPAALKLTQMVIEISAPLVGNAALPFGGVKSSGFGRYKGEWGLHTFCNIKAIMLGPNDKAIEPHWYPQSAAKYALFNRLEAALFRRPRSWLKFLAAGLALTGQGNKEKIR